MDDTLPAPHNSSVTPFEASNSTPWSTPSSPNKVRDRGVRLSKLLLLLLLLLVGLQLLLQAW
jgi:hypothetical protein